MRPVCLVTQVTSRKSRKMRASFPPYSFISDRRLARLAVPSPEISGPWHIQPNIYIQAHTFLEDRLTVPAQEPGSQAKVDE